MQAIFSPPSVTHSADCSMAIVLALPQVKEEKSLGAGVDQRWFVHGGGSEVGGVAEGKNRGVRYSSVDGERNSERNVGL